MNITLGEERSKFDLERSALQAERYDLQHHFERILDQALRHVMGPQNASMLDEVIKARSEAVAARENESR